MQRILNSNRYRSYGTYLPMRVVDHGVLCGFISMNRQWAGFPVEEYERVASIAMGLAEGNLEADLGSEELPDGGYPIHADSKNWPEEFLSAAMALAKTGDISKPIYSDLGIHILYYASDIPAGEHALTADEQETLNTSALYYYQNQELEKLISQWRGEYEIETHPELLDD